MKGLLLKDPKEILIQQTKNVQAARQIRFTGVEEIVNMESTLKAYIKEAVNLEKAGVKVSLKKTSEFEMPDEFKHVLSATPSLKKAFLCTNTRTTTGIPAALLLSKAIQNTGGKD